MSETAHMELAKPAETDLYDVNVVNANSDKIDAYCYQTRQNTLTNAAAIERKQDALTFDTTPLQSSTNPVTSDGIYSAINAVNTLLKAVVLDSGADLNDLYISQSPVTADCVTRKWVIPSATVGASLQHLPATYKTVYANCEIEWHTVKNNGVGYQILTAGTNASFQRFMRFRNADGWGSWHTLFDTDNV